MSKINIESVIEAPIEFVWEKYTNPNDIVKWNFASDDWHTTRAENDLKVGGSFLSRMEAKDGSMGFDFGGTYTNIIKNQLIEYKLGDERIVKIVFSSNNENNKTKIETEFDAESHHSIDMQKSGWQSILNNFKSYVEKNKVK